jgi:hypothetical protein
VAVSKDGPQDRFVIPGTSMTRHIVARTAEIPPGGNKVVKIDGRDVVVFHVNGEFFALLNRCPHAGAPLDTAACVARLTSPEPGVYQRSRVGELPVLIEDSYVIIET